MHWSNSHKLEAHLTDEADAERLGGVRWDGGAPASTASAAPAAAAEGGGDGGGGGAADAVGEIHHSCYGTDSRFFASQGKYF